MLFPILEDVVESSRDSYVYFNKFSVKKESTGPLASVSLSGVAIDYPTLYRQVNNFKEVQKKIDREKVYEMFDSGMKKVEISRYFNSAKSTITDIIIQNFIVGFRHHLQLLKS
jgi:hypothetical protein